MRIAFGSVVYKNEDLPQVASGVTPSDRAGESSNNRIHYLNNVVNRIKTERSDEIVSSLRSYLYLHALNNTRVQK